MQRFQDKRPVRLGFAGFGLAAALAGCTVPEPVSEAPREATRGLTLVAIGDMPYRPRDIAPFEALLTEINSIRPAVTIHVGDIKGGGTPCTDALFEQQRDYMDGVVGPLVYTPGDNEWTDCHRPSAGGYDPVERLGALRDLFFSRARSRGANPIAVERQADTDPAYPGMVENARWRMDGIRFLTAHVVGSNNGLNRDVPGMVAEYRARDAANTSWIRDGFRLARDEGAEAVVLAFQADPFLVYGIGGGFRATLAAISDGVEVFAGPVLVIVGDGHEYTIDTPFHDRHGRIRENVIRLEVPGAADIRAVRVTIDPDAPKIFSFAPFGPGKAPDEKPPS